jgi:ABC-type nitrate/sulfonate/bicarbonate transport system substrate-binding protein
MPPMIANFPHSSGALPIWMAAERGCFAKEGITVEFQQARGSASQYQGLMAGTLHVFTTLMENVVAYAYGQGEVKIDPPPDAFAFMGGQLGNQKLMARPGIHGIADLKGCTFAASGIRTGNAFVLYAVLAKHGLERDRDYKVVAVGGGPVTVTSLQKAGADAALMTAPNDTQAKELGFNELAYCSAVLGGYQSGVYTARHSWARYHRTELVAFIRALVGGHRAVFSDKAGALSLLRQRLPSLSLAEATSVYAALTSDDCGLNKDGRIEERHVKTVLEMNDRFSDERHAAAMPSEFYDLTYLEEALRA